MTKPAETVENYHHERAWGITSPEIPAYLLERGYATSVEAYRGNSDRIVGFRSLTEARDATYQLFGLETLVPAVTVLRHDLWLEWLRKGKSFTPETRDALTEIFTKRLDCSKSGALALRHAFVAPELPESQGSSRTDLQSVEAIFEALEYQYETRINLGWQDRSDVDVTLNLQDFTDPPTTFSFNYEAEGVNAPLFHDGMPPTGGYITTSDNGNVVTINYLYGDNRAAMEMPELCEVAHVTITEPQTPGLAPVILLGEIESRERKFILLDRKDRIVEKAILPPSMQTGRINISDLDLIRMAAFAHSATKIEGFQGEDIKVEFSWGADGPYFNQLTKLVAKEKIDPTSLEPEYVAALVINNPADADFLADIEPDYTLPGAIILTKEIQKEDFTILETGGAIDKIMETIQMRMRLANTETESRWWANILIISGGSGAAHRINNAMSRTAGKFTHLVLPILPNIRERDRLALILRESTGTYWLQNKELAGDGKYVYVLPHYPVMPPVETIGLKAFNVHTGLKAAGLPTPTPFVLSTEGFAEILKQNEVYELWSRLPEAGPKKLVELFSKIHERLQKVPPEIMAILLDTIIKHYPDTEGQQYIARSNAPLEDKAGANNNLAGNFSSVPNLSIDKRENTIYTSTPLSIEDGILEVIRSAFTPEMAEHLAGMRQLTRKDYLRQWVMPVLVMPQVNAACSGTVYRHNVYLRKIDQIVIEAQAGIGGAVDTADTRPLVRIIVNEHDVECNHPIMSVSGPGIEGEMTISGYEELAGYLGREFDHEQMIALVKSSKHLSKRIGKPQDTEWALERASDKNRQPKIWYTQTRDQH